MRSYSLGLTLAAMLIGTAGAQSFDYTDFSSTAGLDMNGNAQQSGTALRVASSIKSDKGSVYYNQPLYVDGGFTTTFTFAISNPLSGGADGLALLIHNDPAGTAFLGDHASALGYGGFASSPTNAVDNALVIELDTFFGSSWNDPDGNHISIQTGGTGDCSQDHNLSVGTSSPSTSLKSGTHTLRVNYNGTTLSVYLDGSFTPEISVPWSFQTGGTYLAGGAAGGLNLINGTDAYIGFTAAGGGSANDHDLLSWNFTSNPSGPIGTSYCSPANLNSTGSSAFITAVGQTSAAANNVRLDVTGLPANQFGMFLTSQTQGFIPNVGGSQGNMCLGGSFGRYKTNLVNSGAGGTYSLQLDLTQTPTSGGLVSVQAGETWHFQSWYRDKNPTNTSNFTDGVSILFN